MLALLNVLIALQRDAEEVSFALLSTFLLCVNVGEDKEGLSPLFIFFSFSPFGALSDDQARHQRRGGKNDTPFCCFHA